MQLIKVQLSDGTIRWGVFAKHHVNLLRADASAAVATLDQVFQNPNPAQAVAALVETAKPALSLDEVALLAPIDQQEIWAAGVTYKRSREARERESVGAARFYDLVYAAERPELFFKAPARRVVGPGQPVRVRRDSRWTVPEPELALVLSPDLRIVAYTIGNDMSARDIEGENPLYLPQAKVYDGACALGPALTLAADFPPLEAVTIRLAIERQGSVAFDGSTSLNRMARSFTDLVAWLGRDNSFLDGAILLTGTGIVPPDDFALAAGDVVSIDITGIGRLVNPVS